MQVSQTGFFSFHLYDETNRLQNARIGETKLASKIRFGKDTISSKYLILGISEDIGPQMNGGFPGSNYGFTQFCQALQTVQSNEYLSGENIGILGEIVQNFSFKSIDECNGWVEELDEFVFHILGQYLISNQKLIAVGGGHNNAYPLIANASLRTNKKVHAINIDPHADCRTTEYRHSGNPFSCSHEKGILKNYSLFGLHESYNNQFILDFLKTNQFSFISFESFVDNPILYWQKWNEFVHYLDDNDTFTLDIDLDAIAFNPSSALSPSGFSVEDIRKKIRSISSEINISVFHLPEGAPQSEIECRLYGKMVSYFIIDFIKCQESIL